MLITVKLFASLGSYLPAELDGRRRDHNELVVDLAAGTTVDDVVERFHLPRQLVHLVVINGVFVPPRERAARVLESNDELAIWPPIAGG